MYSQAECAGRWNAVLAPRTGDPADELAIELSEYLKVPVGEIRGHLANASERFTDEWRQRVTDPSDEQAVTRFYNESRAEIFDLARWHSEDPIHYRTLICADVADSAAAGRGCLDYGSGIGSDALMFASVGFHVTLADVSEPLLAFARWRFERRGMRVASIDLKRQRLPRAQFDVGICFDVLEHLHRPLRALDAIRHSMKPGGLLFVHAPFGYDPLRPMHLVHEDVVTPRMRSVGFHWREDLEAGFPQWLWHPRVYQSFEVSAFDRLGYRLYDRWRGGPFLGRLARLYRQFRPNNYSARA